ncbi:MAG: hypothetical protein AAF206_31530, partial [Bacteroidota bacterium]
LASSPASRAVEGKQFIDINDYLLNPRPSKVFNDGNQIMGLMAEGLFTSLFNGREAPTDSLAPEKPSALFGARNNPSAPGKIAMISDGEFALGKMSRGERQRIPYDNKDLLMNVVDYLAGDAALTQIRSKEVVARRLDREKVREQGGTFRWINLLLPNLLIILFGVLRFYLRKRKQAAKQIA